MAGCSVPVGHAVHTTAPGLALMDPGEHGMHSAQPPGEKVPMGHGMHWDAPSMEYSPAPHEVQLVAASTGACVPLAQGKQEVAPRNGEKVPVGQCAHAVLSLELALMLTVVP